MPTILRRLLFGALLIVGAILVFVPEVSYAQSSNTSAPVSQPPAAADTLQKVVAAIVQTVTAAFEALIKNEGLASAGSTLTNSLFVMVLAWAMVKTMISGEGLNGIVAEAIPLFATMAIIKGLLESGGVSQIVSTMDSVAASFGATGTLSSDLTEAAKKGLTAISNILTMPSPSSNVPLSFDAISNAIGMAITAMIGVLARLLAAILVVIGVSIYMATIVLAHGSIMLAVAMAPIMVPFILVPALGWIFDGWLKFTIGAGMIKVVGTFMIAFTDQLMDGLATLSEKVKLPENTDFATLTTTNLVVMMGLVLLAFMATYMMIQVPQLATGLLSGSAGGAGFRGIRAVSGGVGFQGAKSASSNAMTGAVNGTTGTAGAGLAGLGKYTGKDYTKTASNIGRGASQAYGALRKPPPASTGTSTTGKSVSKSP